MEDYSHEYDFEPEPEYLTAEESAEANKFRAATRRLAKRFFRLHGVAWHKGRKGWTQAHQVALEWARDARLFRFDAEIDQAAVLGPSKDSIDEDGPAEAHKLSELRMLLNEHGGAYRVLRQWETAVEAAVQAGRGEAQSKQELLRSFASAMDWHRRNARGVLPLFAPAPSLEALERKALYDRLVEAETKRAAEAIGWTIAGQNFAARTQNVRRKFASGKEAIRLARGWQLLADGHWYAPGQRYPKYKWWRYAGRYARVTKHHDAHVRDWLSQPPRNWGSRKACRWRPAAWYELPSSEELKYRRRAALAFARKKMSPRRSKDVRASATAILRVRGNRKANASNAALLRAWARLAVAEGEFQEIVKAINESQASNASRAPDQRNEALLKALTACIQAVVPKKQSPGKKGMPSDGDAEEHREYWPEKAREPTFEAAISGARAVQAARRKLAIERLLVRDQRAPTHVWRRDKKRALMSFLKDANAREALDALGICILEIIAAERRRAPRTSRHDAMRALKARPG